MSDSIEDFWSWVECGLSNSHRRLHNPNVLALDAAFAALSGATKEKFSDKFARLLEAANTLGIWQLCSLVSHQPCGDDSFSYFRRWLVLQGKEVYTTTLNNPDDFSILFQGQENLPLEPFLESAGLVEEHEFFVENRPARPQPSWTWLDSSANRIRDDLPKMWRLVGEQFSWDRETRVNNQSACHIPGLGIVKVGDRLLHKAGFGIGTVADIVIPENAIAEINFPTGTKKLRISSTFFERV